MTKCTPSLNSLTAQLTLVSSDSETVKEAYWVVELNLIGFNSQTSLSILTISSNSARFCSLCRLLRDVNLTILRTSTSEDRLYNFSQLTLVQLLDRI